MKLVMHSYSFRNYPVEHVFAAARHFAFGAVELASCHFDAAEARRDLAAAVRLGRRLGVEVHCAGYYGDFIAAEPARTRSIDTVRTIIDACADNGVELVNGFGGWLAGDESDWRRNGSAMAGPREYERTAAAYRTVCDHAADRGVRVSAEVHPNTIHDTIESALRLAGLVGGDSLIITPDPANAYILAEADRDPACLDRLGQVPYFHLKNCLPGDRCPDFTVGTADGVLDNHRWLAKLTSLKVGAVCLEYCGSGDPHPAIAAARDYVDESLRLGEALREYA